MLPEAESHLTPLCGSRSRPNATQSFEFMLTIHQPDVVKYMHQENWIIVAYLNMPANCSSFLSRDVALAWTKSTYVKVA